MKLSLVTAPALFPVTLQEMKDRLYLSISNQDADLWRLIIQATQRVEAYLRRKLVTQTWKMFLDDWPENDFIRLPFGRLQSVASIYYRDRNGDSIEFVDDHFEIDTADEPGRVVLVDGASWPSDTLYANDPISITFTCGFYHGAPWEAGKSYSQGALCVPILPNGMVYECTTAGQSGASEPDAWPVTIDGTVSDGGATWTCKGEAVPESAKHAIKTMVADDFLHRESIVKGTVVEQMPTITRALNLSPGRLYGVYP